MDLNTWGAYGKCWKSNMSFLQLDACQVYSWWWSSFSTGYVIAGSWNTEDTKCALHMKYETHKVNFCWQKKVYRRVSGLYEVRTWCYPELIDYNYKTHAFFTKYKNTQSWSTYAISGTMKKSKSWCASPKWNLFQPWDRSSTISWQINSTEHQHTHK